MEIYWPGTKIVKSQNNAFSNWRTEKKSVMNGDGSYQRSKAATKGRVATGEVPSHLRIYKEKL
jgi:hypothetical protein